MNERERAVAIRDGALWVRGERIPLLSAEVHYWRVAPECWGAILERVRELGLGMIATYVPWGYHELAPGSFDFTGASAAPRDLVGFLELAAERGLKVFLRPGPYIYAEWIHAGVPERVAGLARLSAAYRAEARVWMEAVVAAARDHLAGRGGPICLWQVDNEMDLFSHWFEDVCGLDGGAAGFFQEFLAASYPGVEALNAAWGTRYESIEQAQALAEPFDGRDPAQRVRWRDYWRFQHWAVCQALRWHVESYRALGIDLPLVANYYPGGDVQCWREVAEVVDLVGIDWYPRVGFGGSAEEQRRFLDTCRYQEALSPLPFLAELECGVWHGFHEHVGVPGPEQYRLLFASLAMAGMRGFNWYMLVGRDNWYYSPIDERGRERGELAEILREVHAVAARCDLPLLRRRCDVAALIDPVQVASDALLRRNPVLAALHAGDVDHEIVDGASAPIAAPVLFYAAADWLGRDSQEMLRDFVEAGGKLVLAQAWPRRAEDMAPCDVLGVRPPDRVLSGLGKRLELELGDLRPRCEGAPWCWDDPPGEALWARQVAGEQQAVENAEVWMQRNLDRRLICGYREPRGRGELIVLGLAPSGALARALVRWLGSPLHASAELAQVKTALFESGDELWLFATNLAGNDLRCAVDLDTIDARDLIEVEDSFSGERWSCPANALSIRIPARSGGAWRIREGRLR